MPSQINDVLLAFAPFFKAKRFRNQFSMEIRVKDDHAYFTDATTRLGLPSTASQLEAWDNYPEIVWAGAHGELVQPETSVRFTAELNVSVHQEGDLWPTVETSPEMASWLKLGNCMWRDGVTSFPTECLEPEHAGWIVATGQTPREAVDKVKGYLDELPEGLSADAAQLAEVIKEIEKEEEKGIEFTDQPMPAPAEVVQ